MSNSIVPEVLNPKIINPSAQKHMFSLRMAKFSPIDYDYSTSKKSQEQADPACKLKEDIDGKIIVG